MENNHKNIDKLFRDLSEQEQPKSFPNMDKIWDKVEEKLDQDKKKRVIPFWRYAGIAAALLLLISLGSKFIFNKSIVENTLPDSTEIVVIDQDKIKEEFNNIQNSEDVVAFEDTKEQKDEIHSYIPPIILENETLENEIVIDATHSEVQKTPSNVVVPLKMVENKERNLLMPSNDNSSKDKIGVRNYIDSKRTKEETQNAYFRGNAYTKELQGQVSGVNINSSNGNSGSDSTVRIRGFGSMKDDRQPLYVVDGKPITKEELNKLNSNDIDNVVVLKDKAATSIYGSRAVNGVVIIQSKNDVKKSGKRNSTDSIKVEDINKFFPPVEIDTESYENFKENEFESAKSNPVSTFSIDVDNASYTNIRRFINNGQTVPKDAVRIEEMINFFKYDYPKPNGQHPFSIHTEYSDAPWNPNHKLLRIALQGKEIPTDNLPKSNFVFLVDVSGSMEAPNKLPLLKSSMKVLLDELREEDRVSIVYYANNVGVLLEPTKAADKKNIIEAIDKMNASGGTSGGAGLELAYQMAEKYFVKGGNNRIILATDGDFNIGKSSDKEMQELIEEKRKSGVFLTCLGFGMGNYKDSKMMTLSKKGNGNYAYIDNIQEANRFLGKEFKGSMYAIAKDVKIQIEFNPTHVQAYRLIGYEMRKLRNDDFTNDAIDAGELGSGHTVTALYEVIPSGVKSEFYKYENDLKYTQNTSTTNFQNELATVKFRYKKPDGDKSIEMVHTIQNVSKELKFVSKDFKFATSVAWFGLKLRDSKLISNKNSQEIIKLAQEGLQNDSDGYKAEFIRLVKSVK